ncbi:MAG: transaldolase [Phycisphaerales bacterium]|nr:transaldolase [Phycisphaerales bacterium]
MRATALLAMTGQSIWLDNITRKLLDSGQLATWIKELSVVGLTSNPSIFEKAITGSNDYDAQIRPLIAKGMKPEQIFFECAISDLTRAADLFKPVAQRTGSVDGWVSLEVSPLLANDTAATIAQAIDLHARANRPNLFIKVPGTPEGVPAIEELIAAGVSINVTLLFSEAHFAAAAEAYLRGLERRAAAGLPLGAVSSVASLFVSRWDRKTAPKLPAELKNTVGIAVSRACYHAYCTLYCSDRWLALEAKGARPQRLLYASTSTKDPALSPTLYVEGLASPRTVNTMPQETLIALSKATTIGSVLAPSDVSWRAVLDTVTKAGIDLKVCAAELQIEGRDSFNKSWIDLIANIETKSAALAS